MAASLACRNVRMELRQGRDQKASAPVEPRRACGHGGRGCRRDARNPAIPNDDGLIGKNPVAVHRNHGDVLDRDHRRLLACRT